MLGGQTVASQCISGKAEFQPVIQLARRKRQQIQSAPEGQECLVNVHPLLVAHAQSPELVQPSEGPFDHPAPSPQSAAMFGIALRKKRDDVSVTQTLPDRLRVITTVAQYAIRTMPWASPLSLQSWDGINQWEGLSRVIAIGPRELNRQRNSASIANQMALAAQLGPVGGIRSRLQSPKTARIELPSTTARDQSIFP
jgi:hypothetical protein